MSLELVEFETSVPLLPSPTSDVTLLLLLADAEADAEAVGELEGDVVDEADADEEPLVVAVAVAEEDTDAVAEAVADVVAVALVSVPAPVSVSLTRPEELKDAVEVAVTLGVALVLVVALDVAVALPEDVTVLVVVPLELDDDDAVADDVDVAEAVELGLVVADAVGEDGPSDSVAVPGLLLGVNATLVDGVLETVVDTLADGDADGTNDEDADAPTLLDGVLVRVTLAETEAAPVLLPLGDGGCIEAVTVEVVLLLPSTVPLPPLGPTLALAVAAHDDVGDGLAVRVLVVLGVGVRLGTTYTTVGTLTIWPTMPMDVSRLTSVTSMPVAPEPNTDESTSNRDGIVMLTMVDELVVTFRSTNDVRLVVLHICELSLPDVPARTRNKRPVDELFVLLVEFEVPVTEPFTAPDGTADDVGDGVTVTDTLLLVEFWFQHTVSDTTTDSFTWVTTITGLAFAIARASAV